ncbi:hypothetical protein GCM10009550_65270 [Actinocorallia libanotica]|uniref:Uncharacterized protein n=1 Tax=Actinocorallia libanotica TaxID=46162 RepID=A0ABN1RVV7_9ACTN
MMKPIRFVASMEDGLNFYRYLPGAEPPHRRLTEPGPDTRPTADGPCAARPSPPVAVTSTS